MNRISSVGGGGISRRRVTSGTSVATSGVVSPATATAASPGDVYPASASSASPDVVSPIRERTPLGRPSSADMHSSATTATTIVVTASSRLVY